MSVYRTEFEILASDVDMHRRLRLSRLFTMIQEISIAHTKALGMGRDKTLDRGLLWVVTMQRADVDRLPVYDEKVTLETWAGRTMHVMFPRYYRMTDENGRTLLTASGFWMLINEKTRAMAFPEKEGIVIPETKTGFEPPLPSAPKSIDISKKQVYTVPYSAIDINGHMNNARYLDVAENVMPAALRERGISRVTCEYAAEIRPEECVRLETGVTENAFYMACMRDDKRLFRLRFDYQERKSEA